MKRIAEPADDGTDEDEGLDAVGVGERIIDRQPAAGGGTDEYRPSELQVFGERMEIGEVRVWGRGHVGTAVPAAIITNDTVVPADVRNQIVPHFAVSNPVVYENERKAVAKNFVEQTAVLDLEVLGGRGGTGEVLSTHRFDPRKTRRRAPPLP